MAHAHDAAPGRELALEPGLGARGRADRVEHVEHRAGRAAVQRPLQRADRADDRRDQRPTPVEAITRAVNVDAFMPWSITVTRYASSAAARAGAGDGRHHAQKIGGVAQRRVGREGARAGLAARPGGGEHRQRRRQLSVARR